MVIVKCIECGKAKETYKSLAVNAKFCSYQCRGIWRSKNWLGANHPNYKPEGREPKTCKHCGVEFSMRDGEIITNYRRRMFCSKACADKGGFRLSGESHPNYNPTARRKNRGGSHKKWVNAVIGRDNAKCQDCGATGIELHAHHIKSYRDFPELRFDVDNGKTLCHKCHWQLHAALNAKAVNSVNTLTGNAEGNTEPSFDGNIVEGVTTRGRAFRRVVVPCGWCGSIVSKSLSDAKGKEALLCSKKCMGNWIWHVKRARQ